MFTIAQTPQSQLHACYHSPDTILYKNVTVSIINPFCCRWSKRRQFQLFHFFPTHPATFDIINFVLYTLVLSELMKAHTCGWNVSFEKERWCLLQLKFNNKIKLIFTLSSYTMKWVSDVCACFGSHWLEKRLIWSFVNSPRALHDQCIFIY